MYCRGELTNEQEVSQQYHLSCRNEFKIGPSDFEIFDQGKVDTFSKEVSLSRRISIQETFFMMFLMVGSFYLLATDFILSLCFFLLFIILLFRSAYNWGKVDNIQYFCDIVKEINPQFIHLTKKHCIASIGEIYVVCNPKMFDLFRGMYIIKFLRGETIESNKSKIPEAPFFSAFNKKKYSMRFAKVIKNCQIHYNAKKAKKGLATIYYVRYNDIHNKESNLNKLIYSLNRT